jgi:CheY-like chemotaxis protein
VTKVEGTPFILVVDDHEDVVQEEVRSLQQAGWAARGTSDPWDAIQIIAETSPSLIVLDLDMEGIGAGDFCLILQDDPGMKDIPVIFLSTHASVIGPRLASFLGENACLAKPFNGPSLIAAAKRLLGSPFPPEEVEDEERAAKAPTRFVRRRRDALRLGQTG